jgi:hypothetical protein
MKLYHNCEYKLIIFINFPADVQKIEQHRFWHRTLQFYSSCRIWDSPSSVYEELYLLGYNPLQFGESQPRLSRNMSPLSSGSKRYTKQETSMNQAQNCAEQGSVNFHRTTQLYIPEDRTLVPKCFTIRISILGTVNMNRKWFMRNRSIVGNVTQVSQVKLATKSVKHRTIRHTHSKLSQRN